MKKIEKVEMYPYFPIKAQFRKALIEIYFTVEQETVKRENYTFCYLNSFRLLNARVICSKCSLH